MPSIKNPDNNTYPYVIQYTYNSLGQKTAMKVGSIGSGSEPGGIDPYYWTYDNDPDTYWQSHWASRPLVNVVYDAEYAYYANGWLKSVKSGANSVADYTYDVVGNRTRTDLGNGTYTTYAYDTDPRYRLTTITHKNSSDATLATIDYTSTARDKVGNPKSMTDWTGTWAYGYDDMNRLTSATAPAPVPGQPAGGSGALAYGYDWVGNRIHPPSGANPMVHNKADQLTSWPGMRQYTYHGDGSLHEVKNAGGTTTLATYTYTPDGLLDAASYGGRTLTNTWDAESRRVGMTVNSTDYSFVYDAAAGIPAVIEEVSAGSTSTTTARYFREPSGALISRVQGASTSYYHFDALGSTRLLTDSSQTVTDKYAYDAYGALIAHERFTGSVDQPYQYVGQVGYYTHWMEPSFGLLQLGMRFYDAENGRFTQLDPAKEDFNRYTYTLENPCVGVDPNGLWCHIVPHTRVDKAVLNRKFNNPGRLAVLIKFNYSPWTGLPINAEVTCEFAWTESVTYLFRKRHVLVKKCGFLCFTTSRKDVGPDPLLEHKDKTWQDTVNESRSESFTFGDGVYLNSRHYEQRCIDEGIRRGKIPPNSRRLGDDWWPT